MPKTFGPEEFFYPGNLLRVECYDEHSVKRIFHAVVNSFINDELILEISDFQEDYQTILKSGSEIALICRYRDDNFFFSTQVTAGPQGNPLLLKVNRPTKIQIASRRNFFRCSVNIKVNYLVAGEEYTGRVHNLSACGLYAIIKSDERLYTGMAFPIQLFLPSIPQPLKLEGKIVRMETLNKDDQLGVALNFENCSESIQNKITKYLFQRQRELIKRGHVKLKHLNSLD